MKQNNLSSDILPIHKIQLSQPILSSICKSWQMGSQSNWMDFFTLICKIASVAEDLRNEIFQFVLRLSKKGSCNMYLHLTNENDCWKIRYAPEGHRSISQNIFFHEMGLFWNNFRSLDNFYQIESVDISKYAVKRY